MKISVGMSCYNESSFLDYAIQAIHPYVDAIVLTDQAMKAALEVGFPSRSIDGTQNIIDKWVDGKKVFFAEHRNVPTTFGELMAPCLDKAKELGADYYLHVGSDEVWSESALKMLKPFLAICEKKGILGLNVWMNIFAPDFWHYKDFRNARIGKITKDCYIGRDGDALVWKDLGLYQYSGDCEKLYPDGVPKEVVAVNGDFPRRLRPFHYSCVGKDRVDFKVKFWKNMNGTYGDRYNKAYVEKDWNAFKEYGYKPFTGQHPEIMKSHPLYSERLY